MATALTPSSQIALRAAVSVFCGGKWNVDISDALAYVRGTYPIMGKMVESRDISQQLRKLRFVRDHDAGPTAWKHSNRDHPRWGKSAADVRGESL